MAVTNYYTVEGRIIGEETSGVRTDYLSDALGSVTATVDQSAAVLSQYRYKPYGASLSSSGGGARPKFDWVGTHGYRNTGRAHSDKYVRARHYGTAQGAWITCDLLWPREGAYIYASPAVSRDHTGLAPGIQDDGCAACQQMCGYKSLAADIAVGMTRFIAGYRGANGTGGPQKSCVDACGDKWAARIRTKDSGRKNKWDSSCMMEFTRRYPNRAHFRCLTEPTSEAGFKTPLCSLREGDKFCYEGCEKKTFRAPALAETMCSKFSFNGVEPTGLESLGRINICCYSMCGQCGKCPKDFSDSECMGLRGTDRIMNTILHEMFHLCSTDCSDHHADGATFFTPHQCFAECAAQCFSPPLYSPPFNAACS